MSDPAIRDAVYVATIFNTIDRIADAFDFAVPSPEALAVNSRFLLRLGYR